ncbi:alpha-1,2-fucosyltransferase [Segetibacter sp.]|jgi:hypothetical protein|uniref:alpha-1,2-fucosyltransferase n=1 Tax=Segetibacter sp. TaxID=2231182 RepID=UPI00261368DF|nr:alpha-1,2-fucosyltransferase [Segetibacter sp.]
MVISKISMGLGNQMFQYAAGKALSLYKRVPFKLDVSSYEGYGLRKFELDSLFSIQSQKVTKEEVAKYRIFQPVKSVWNKFFPNNRLYFYHLPYEMSGVKRTVLQLAELVSPSYNKRTFLEPYYHFNPNFFKAPDDVFLIGYWMSWRYFEKFDKEIRQDFTIRPELISHLKVIEEKILETNSVSIHIRRSDFTTSKNASLHGLVPIHFYEEAIKEITSKNSFSQFYVFSDDIDWVKQNLHSKYPITFVSNEVTKTAFEDFYLMTICKHNIIANSTFSWWAAYLNNNPNKTVIAPQKWYNQSPYNYKDVYPLSWKILSC